MCNCIDKIPGFSFFLPVFCLLLGTHLAKFMIELPVTAAALHFLSSVQLFMHLEGFIPKPSFCYNHTHAPKSIHCCCFLLKAKPREIKSIIQNKVSDACMT